MASIVEICNLALAKIGQATINSITENSPQALQCNLFYNSSRDALLRQFEWNFSGYNKVLAVISTTVPGWDYVYAYPSNVIDIRYVYSSDIPNPEVPNEFEVVYNGTNKLICCNIYQAYAKCSYIVTDPTLFDPLFTEAFSCKLGLEISTGLTNSTSKKQEVAAMYQQALSNAMLAGSIEGGKPKNPNNYAKSSKFYISGRW